MYHLCNMYVFIDGMTKYKEIRNKNSVFQEHETFFF